MNHHQGSYCTKIQIFSVMLICVLINILMSFAINHYLPVNNQLAIVDITGIIHQFVKMESAQSDSPAKHQERIHAFSAQLESTLQTVAKDHHAILIPKEAVISGGIDLTLEVSKHLEKSDAV
jgi:hypothetical protein